MGGRVAAHARRIAKPHEVRRDESRALKLRRDKGRATQLCTGLTPPPVGTGEVRIPKLRALELTFIQLRSRKIGFA